MCPKNAKRSKDVDHLKMQTGATTPNKALIAFSVSTVTLCYDSKYLVSYRSATDHVSLELKLI